MEVEFRIAPVREYQNYIFKYTGTDGHLALVFENNKSLLQIQQENTVASEKEIYTLAGSEYFPPETREGLFEFQFLKEDRLNRLIENDDLTGILHNHSTYSDGRNSLREMAETCKKLGYQYFGICDGEDVVCVAGIHVYSAEQRVAALGNIATATTHRRRGLARRATARLCQSLLESVDVIGLNVKADNHGAIAAMSRSASRSWRSTRSSC